jgi:ubiquitin C-terminal hydrolase
LAIKNLPNTLIVHLNRITFDIELMRNIKINDRLEFPNTLNVKKYMVEEVHREQRRKIKQKQREQQRKAMQAANEDENEPALKKEDSKQQEVDDVQIDTMQAQIDQEMKDETAHNEEEEEDMADDRKMTNEDCEFKLVGVVIHMGMAEAGHYLSYINIEREGT